MSSLARQKKDKKIIEIANRDTERRIRLSDCIPNLDFRLLKKEKKEEIEFIYNIKKNNYTEDNKQELNEEIQTKLFARYIKENVKNINIITIKEEKIGFFDGKILEDNTFKIDNIVIIKEYQYREIEEAILNEIMFENKDIMKKRN